MLTVLLCERCRSDNTRDEAHRSRQLGFLPSFSNSSDLREQVRFVNTGNNYPYKCIDQVPENERTTKDAKVNSPQGSTVNLGVGTDK